jgi:hypothetical protein
MLKAIPIKLAETVPVPSVIEDCAQQYVDTLLSLLPDDRPDRDELKELKATAWKRALDMYPSARSYYDAFLDAAHTNGVGTSTDDAVVNLGRKMVMIAGGKLSWSYRNKYGELEQDDGGRITMRSRMLDWVSQYDHIPNPQALSHFCGGTYGGWRSTIVHAQNQGYTIEPCKPGFVVVERPAPPEQVQITDKDADELRELRDKIDAILARKQ